MFNKIKETALYIGFTICLIGVLGSLYFSEVLGLVPCILCWYQRIALFPLLIIFIVGIVKRSSDVWYYVWPLASLGWLVALYNIFLVYGVIPETAAVCSMGVSCVKVTWAILGFINIPLLSFLSFTCLIVLAIINHKD